jgi:very-short-patch-repair endonuclease
VETLQRLGYAVETQVGCAGFFIDIAVLDEARPGRYVIGIECDGAAYHSARSARDRDRLRQAVLADLGWQLHRIWSTAWFRERDREIERMVAAIEAAKRGKTPSQPNVDLPEPPDNMFVEELVDADPEAETLPIEVEGRVKKYQTCSLQIDLRGTELHVVPMATLIDWLFRVVEAEGPVHWLEAARRIAAGAGVQRVGGRIQDSIERACKAGSQKKRFVADGEFLKSLNQHQCPIRDRSDLPGQMKRLSLVAPDEIDAAIEFVTGESYGIAFDDACAAACRLLGFARVTDEMQTIAERRRDSLLARRRLEQRGEMLFLCEAPVGR